MQDLGLVRIEKKKVETMFSGKESLSLIFAVNSNHITGYFNTPSETIVVTVMQILFVYSF